MGAKIRCDGQFLAVDFDAHFGFLNQGLVSFSGSQPQLVGRLQLPPKSLVNLCAGANYYSTPNLAN